MVLSSALLAMSALVGCQQNNNISSSTSDEESSSTSSSQQGDVYYLTAVGQNANYAKYLSNIAIDSSRDDGFKVRNSQFRVGDDNSFQFKPILTVVDDDFLPVSSDRWDKPFDIKVEVKNGDNYVNAETSLYEIVDDKECIINFAEEAVGKTFRLTVVPTGISEESKTNFTKVLEFDVVDGYNVYDAKEISLLETRQSKDNSEEMELDAWPNFKTAHNIDPDLAPKNLILQSDIRITLDDLPAEVLYDANKHGETYKGTMRDWSAIYTLDTNREITLFGNYFQFDFSNLPLITYYDSGSHVNSHSELFAVQKGSFTLQDINVTGNSKYATKDGEDKYAGGLMLLKARDACEEINTNNILARDCFITMMGENTTTAKGYVDYAINDCKFSNNYNSFLYNWSGVMTAKNTDFVKVGGPIVIQDHTNVSSGEKYESDDYTTINGKTSKTIFNNCKLDNYVAGSEAWFVQFGADTILGQIKGLSDLYSYHFGLTFLYDADQHKPVTTAAPVQTINFIAINKSGNAEGPTVEPACGEIIINNDTEENDFNYSQPTLDDCYAAATAQAFAQAIADAGTDPAKLMEVANAFNVPYNSEGTDLVDNLTAKGVELQEAAKVYITHATLRGVNAAGGPVFESGKDFAYFDGSHTYLQPLDNARTGATDPISETADFGTKATHCTALYYNGMMIILGMDKLSA